MRILMTVLLSLLPLTSWAGVSYDEETKTATVSGATTSDQWVELNRVLASKEVRGLTMFGPGGDYYAGLALGRLIAEHNLVVTVPAGMKCTSACAFAALASPKVYVDGSLLLHRGYFRGVSTMITLDEFARLNSVGHHDGTKYLIEMGYTFNFAKMVIADTSPCKFIVVDSSAFAEQLRGKGPFDITVNLPTKRHSTCEQVLDNSDHT